MELNSEEIKKANKRIIFLIFLKQENVPAHYMICFCLTYIRLVLEYCTHLFHHAFPAHLRKDLEHVQRPALFAISRGLSLHHNLALHNTRSLKDRHHKNSVILFLTQLYPQCNIAHKLQHLLPPKDISRNNFRNQLHLMLPKMCINHYKSTCIPSMSSW